MGEKIKDSSRTDKRQRSKSGRGRGSGKGGEGNEGSRRRCEASECVCPRSRALNSSFKEFSLVYFCVTFWHLKVLLSSSSWLSFVSGFLCVCLSDDDYGSGDDCDDYNDDDDNSGTSSDIENIYYSFCYQYHTFHCYFYHYLQQTTFANK